MSVLRVDGLGKAFNAYRRELHRLARWFGMRVEPARRTWVLKDVTFDLEPGQAIGLIGRNGAGKSTLLKLVAGTLVPSEGQVEVNGRIAAILELGMGFNTELTGRQNAHHAAALMGFSAREIEAKMPEIEDFAEVGDYFDQPMRTYSSGMEMRVAFAVATAWRPDILIVDEALSVGDGYFQHKSLSRMRQFRSEGSALLLVSHDAQAVKSLCDRAMLIDEGTVARDGTPEEIYDYYNAMLADRSGETIKVEKLSGGHVRTTSGSGEASIVSVALRNASGQATEAIGVGDPVELHIRFKINEPIETLVIGYGIRDRFGQVVYGTNTLHTKQVMTRPEAGKTYDFRASFAANLGVGTYSIQIALVDIDGQGSGNYAWQDTALVIAVENIDKVFFEGCLWAEPKIAIGVVDS